jgi:hypothetical protein
MTMAWLSFRQCGSSRRVCRRFAGPNESLPYGERLLLGMSKHGPYCCGKRNQSQENG